MRNSKLKFTFLVAEATPLIQKLDLKIIPNIDWKAPCDVYSGHYGGCKVSIATNGKDKRFSVDNVSLVVT